MGARCCGSTAPPEDILSPRPGENDSFRRLSSGELAPVPGEPGDVVPADLHSCVSFITHSQVAPHEADDTPDDFDAQSCYSIASPPGADMEIVPPPSMGMCYCPGEPQNRFLANWWLTHDDLDTIATGDTFFTLMCRRGVSLSNREKQILRSLLYLSRFKDEAKDNGVEVVDIDSPADLAAHTFIIARAMYLLPDARISDLPLELLVSKDYHTACQPGKPVVWDCTELNTFRITKHLAPLFSMVIQMQCSELAHEDLAKFTQLTGGIRPHRAVLMERTKRTLGKKDMTKMCKSLLCYHELPNGALICVNTTAVANTPLPSAAEWAVNRFGKSGTHEVGETAQRTRSFLRERKTHGYPAQAG
eukprot:TRINITY_DN47229_c0_g1_i1.p1 TRINITY_DN47229_c0_g1~~TRINITY_DN47229_c0_g1_i1.p1  ORF type:complete len:388 (+),score=101.00 TRINITY_DN47229_c0_g1_i1:84-1166(+)